MGHREELLAAARRCLATKGYARTTARDLVADSDTNLGSIGYHFGSKEALLNLAIKESIDDYADKLLAMAGPLTSDEGGRERTRQTWEAMVSGFSAQRPNVIAFLEALVQAEHAPDVRDHFAEVYRGLRERVTESASDVIEKANVSPEALASFLIAVCDGLMIQWILDPDRVPPGAEVFDAAVALFTE